MSMPGDRRSRKRLETRRIISTAATRLFLERGFEQVTVDEIAAAAGVGRMTVFNHFPRKEEMFFDRDDEVRETIRQALKQRQTTVSPVETLRLLAHSLVAQNSPFVEFSADSQHFIGAITGSETLKARVRQIRDELTQLVTTSLIDCVNAPAHDPDACLTAHLVLATWSAALAEGHRRWRDDQHRDNARTAFLAIIDKGSRGISAAMCGTPYV
ncbi:TetR/AcrR family transcriptional regulator [[Enterobacter] lignolyticus]|uniref:Regulatory protein TetR n=1 Tax=Enterobacter lignolyticus (strain SCF1) TaxID=701347 RepID=E3G7A2_ENTLS|nr:TetR/AcrR family transcriptional regulator [[Enterobacter] lignolyticus]ADO48524.1 regulatory protein TetR [[Enterobacter] lignolyticus SCF1]